MTIRNQVFVEGQGVPLSDEQDGKDDESDHFLLFVDNQPAGTARVRYMENVAKIERVAIQNAWRGMKLGQALMHAIMADLEKNPFIEKARLGSQTHAIPFYTKLGFEICSDEYMDAGIPHKDMHFMLHKM